ncbi:MAG TPA: lysyl oxidase family protein [Actinomycetota bacterium]|nr:lysyl oxidase family protein [Actinomycetota bacterium]
MRSLTVGSRRPIAVAAFLAAVLVAVATVSPSPAAEPQGGIITVDQPLVTWAGSFGASHPPAVAPEARCLEQACDEFTVTVSLGDTYWDSRGGGAIEVAVRWPYDGVTDLDLVVYDSDGYEVGRSAGVDSNAESLFLKTARDDQYVVRVVPSNTFNPESTATVVRYQGLAQIEPAIHDPDARDLLPDLVALKPDGFNIATAAGLLPQPRNPLISCYPEETIESPSHPTRCLRFNQTIGNIGEGPLELRFRIDGVASTDTADQQMVQRIHDSAGGFRDRLADSYEFHAVHGHVHYKGFGQSFLWPVTWTGSGPERIPTPDGRPAAAGKKVGFCVIDVALMDDYWGAQGNGPRTWTFPVCNVPTEQDERGTWLVQGISVGWADIYGWNLPDQYVDITTLKDGLYEVQQLANPNLSVVESDYTNDTASAVVCISGTDVREVVNAAQAATCV